MSAAASTLPNLLRERAAAHWERPLLIDGTRRLTYGEFARIAARTANGFLRLGVRKGDKIALLLPNCPEFLLAVFAAAEIGAVFVPVNTAFAAEEIGYVLEHSEAKYLLTSAEYLPLIDKAREFCRGLARIIVLGAEQSEFLGWNEFLHGASADAPEIAVEPDDLASITYTSGTTDHPKGVMLTQFAYAFAPQKRAEALGWNERDRALVVLPLFHVNALCHTALALLSVGGSLALTKKFSASRFWHEAREYGATTSSMMRTIPTILLKLAAKADDADNPLRLAVALLPPELHVEFEERFGLTVCGSYSLTEDILSVVGPPDKSRRKVGSSGLPAAPDVHKIKIVDDDGVELPVGRLGEIVKQSPAVMRGYYKNPAATAAALKDGWLYTGDLGYLDEDGFLYFMDRKKDMVKRGDENISAEEVERVLNSHPAVAESAVIGVSDPIRQEELKACIVLKPRANDAGAEAIWSYCAERLAAFKVPRYVEFLAELPKTPSSKVQKHLLREASGGIVFDRTAPGKK
ncbi:MAG TPA: AMP-binding protein [Verrucomicrobiae bacterium]|nr:AMP-binding protein [Verrucomicrobiae bacterium]